MPTRRFRIAENLARLMAERGVSIPDLTRRSHISREFIGKYLAGSRANAPNVRKIAQVFKVSVNELCPGCAAEIRAIEQGNTRTGPPCGMKRALEIVGADYIDSPHMALHFDPPRPRVKHEGKLISA
jgi:hypothetical protein